MRGIAAIVILVALMVQPARADIGRLRLLVFGDSLSRGLYASSLEGGFKYHLAELMNAEMVGQSGNSLPGLVEIWETWDWQADVIVVEIGLNDLCEDCEWTLSDQEWMRLYTRYIWDLKETGARVVICTMFAAHPEQAKEYEHFMRRNEMIRVLARRMDVRLADLYAVTVGCEECLSEPGIYSPFAPDYEGDNFHPSDHGHQVIAEAVYAALWDEVYIPVMESGGSFWE